MPLPEVTLPRTSVQTLHHAGADYRLLLAWPDEPAPVDGYPIIYALDADATFAMLVSLIRQRSRRPDATGVPPSVVAAIGLAASHADRTRRTWDFTPAGLVPPTGEWPSGAEPRTGGAPALLDWLTEEVREVAERRFPIDPARRTIVGHSLAGFFVVDALLESPARFGTFVAASPSLWWDPQGVMGRAARLASSPAAPAPRVLLSVGEYEQDIAPWQPASAFTEGVRARRARRRMVDHVVELAERLAPLGARGGAVECLRLAGEDHASVIPLTLSRAVRFGPGLLSS